MRKKFSARAAALGMSGVLLTSALTGCTFGFASDPDDPNAVKEEVSSMNSIFRIPAFMQKEQELPFLENIKKRNYTKLYRLENVMDSRCFPGSSLI